MIPVNCITKHDPAAGTYGDCLRACVATVLGLPAEQVLHFIHDDCGAEECNRRLVDYLAFYGLAPFWVHFDGDTPLVDLLSLQGLQNPQSVYLLFGRTESETDHVVVCRGGEIAHDPAWYRSRMIGPGSHGHWSVVVLGRI